MSHHTKDKGDLAVLKVMSDLGQQGFLILNPLTEHAPFDLVAYKNKKFFRTQVKYKASKNGTIRVDLRSSWSDKNGTHTKNFDSSEVDLVAAYCPDTDECYYFKANLGLNSVALRFEKPKNGQTKNIRMAEDYLKVP